MVVEQGYHANAMGIGLPADDGNWNHRQPQVF